MRPLLLSSIFTLLVHKAIAVIQVDPGSGQYMGVDGQYDFCALSFRTKTTKYRDVDL
jgi:hypothetical protein